MNGLKTIKLPTILYSAIIVIISWAFLEGWFPVFRRQWIFLGFGLVMSFFTAPRFFSCKRVIVLFGYLIVLYLNAMSGDKYFSDKNIVIAEVFTLAFPAALLYYIYINKSKKDIVTILSAYLLVLIVSCVASFLIDKFLMPGAIRQMVALRKLEGKESMYFYYRLGLSSYSFPHALPILIPPLIMGIKSKKITKSFKFVCIVLFVATFVLVWLSGTMTALLLAIMFLLLSYFTQEGSIANNIKRLSFIFILFVPLLSPDVLGMVTRYAKDFVGEESSYYVKIEDFEQSLESDYDSSGSDWEARQNLYDQSFSGFAENAFFGTNSMVGGHSSFLDRLGVLGLLGFIPLIWFFILQLKAGAVPIPQKHRVYYYEGCLAGLMMLSIKSTLYPNVTIVLFVVLPLLTYWISISEIE